MAAKLVAEEGSLKGLVLSLDEGNQWVIGRDPDACQLLIEDPSASRKHLICRTTPEGIQVENLSATNPIQVNDEEVKTPRLLQNGDSVKIGSGLFRFYAEAAAQLFNDAEPSAPNGEVKEETKEEVDQQQESHDEQEAEEPPVEEKNIEAPIKEEIMEQEPMAAGENTPANSTEENHIAVKAPPEQTESTPPKEELEERRDSIYEEEPSDQHTFAEINFGILDTGRWLLKVIGGPNNGAEFSMQAGMNYVVGTDPNACDIVFHDTSVSRQHARININQDDSLTIEDLKSRNGTVVDGEPLKGKRPLSPNMLVSVGTTSFVVYDREGEMQTIISPLIPSLVKTLQEEPKKEGNEESPKEEAAIPEKTIAPNPEQTAHQHATTLGAYILTGILTGLFLLTAFGVSTLFRSEPVEVVQQVDPIAVLDNIMSQFPHVKYTFNKSTGQLLLVGHVATATDRSQLLYALNGQKFVKSLDDNGIVIDEYVWREINQVLEKNPDWKGITVTSPQPGAFIVSGYLQTRGQADRLSEYLSNNFPYPDLIEKRIIVDEEVVSWVNHLLQAKGFNQIKVKIDNGDVILNGTIPQGKTEDFKQSLASIKEIRGIRGVQNYVKELAPEQSIINISDKYEVTGTSSQAGKLTVVINGRILMNGDVLDGMTITKVQPNTIYLEKEGTKYRIDF